MTEQRKTTSPPIVANIPAELMEVTQWVVWRFETRAGKPTKVPYTPHSTKKARSNAASSWRSFKSAHSCYLERPDFFDGIGFMFSKDDPYVGGDRDHSLDQEGIPPTYAEISPSGEGIKFIARATGDYGRKTPKGELYSKGRFFTVTGNVIPGHEQITECQAAVEAFHASLGGTERATKEGAAGTGSRAARAASIPDEEWQAGRDQLRSNIGRLLARLRASSVSKKSGVETQLYYLLKEDYHGFHSKWPGAGLVRGDGSIDESQIRAIFSNSIRMRGFTFPEYVALMSHFFAEQALTKWGTKQAWREEMACLWLRGRTPRQGEAEAAPPPPVARGRAGSRAALLDRAYAVLQSYRAGVSAILTVNDLATGLGVHRRTAFIILAELIEKNKITSQKHGQHGGLIIHFPEVIYQTSEVIYSRDGESNLPHPDTSNGHHTNGTQSASGKRIDHHSEVIYSEIEKGNLPTPIAGESEIGETPQSAEGENNASTPEVIYSEIDIEELGGVSAQNDDADLPAERGSKTPLYINNTSTVYLPGSAITSEKRVTLEQVVIAAFDALPKSRANEQTGEMKRWPVTTRRVVEFVREEYAEFKPAAIAFWADKIRKRRKAQTFDELKGLKREALEKKAAAARKRIDAAEKRAATDPMPELREFYGKLARQLEGQTGLLAWELGRRDQADEARILTEGYSQGEQAEMLDLVGQSLAQKPLAKKAPMGETRRDCSPVPGLIERLKARQ